MTLKNKLDPLLTEACENAQIPGVVAMVADTDGVLYEGAAGVRVLGAGQPMTVDTVAWFASKSKAITAAAAMQLVERAKLSLDEPAAKVCPHLGDAQVLEGIDDNGQPQLRPAKGTVTLRNLLTHTSGLAYEFWYPEAQRELETRGADNVLSGTQATLDRPLMADPDTRWAYSPGIDWAGRMVEEVTGQRLGDYMRENLFEPLGMQLTGFHLTEDMRKNMAGIHMRAPDGSLVADPMEIGQGTPLEMGGHGLYGPLGDYLRFTRAILGGGQLEGARILETRTVQDMSRNHIGALEVPGLQAAPPFSNAAEFYPDIACKWGLSFLINTETTREGRSAGSLAWAGLANSYYWIDPVKKITGAISAQILPFFDASVVKLFADMESTVYQESGRS